MLTIGLLTICFLRLTIKLLFDIFKDNLFAINHELNLSSSLETVLHISEISLPVYNKFESSANIMHCIKIRNCMHVIYIFYIIREETPIFAPQKAPVLEGSGSRRLYPMKGTSVDRVYVCSLHVSIFNFFTIRHKWIRGEGAFCEGNSASLKQRRLQQ